LYQAPSLQNWKSFGDGMPQQTTLRLAPLTFLVGPNGSGKSNALDAIRFLQGIALDYPIADVLRGRREGEREVWPPIRGAAVEVANQPSKPFIITSNWQLAVRSVEHSILVSASGEPIVEHERLRDGVRSTLTRARAGSTSSRRRAWKACPFDSRSAGLARQPSLPGNTRCWDSSFLAERSCMARVPSWRARCGHRCGTWSFSTSDRL
jgi:hypothetical protein